VLICGELDVARSDRHEPDESGFRQSRFLKGEDVTTAQGGKGDRAVLAPPTIAGARVPQRVENCVEAGQRRGCEVAVRAAGKASTGAIPEELRSDTDIEASRSARRSALVRSKCAGKDVSMTCIRRVGIGLGVKEAAFALLTLGNLLGRRFVRLLRDEERCERSLRSTMGNGLSSHGSRGRSHISSAGSSQGNGDCRTRDR
jgi:hypothetical protein